MKSLIKRTIFFFLMVSLLPAISYAWEPYYCFKSDVCLGPTFASGTTIDLDGNIEIDSILGIGYGARILNKKPYAIGIDLLGDFHALEKSKSTSRVSLVLSFFKSLRFGFGVELQKKERPRYFFVLGGGLDFKSP